MYNSLRKLSIVKKSETSANLVKKNYVHHSFLHSVNNDLFYFQFFILLNLQEKNVLFI